LPVPYHSLPGLSGYSETLVERTSCDKSERLALVCTKLAFGFF
jgi:hypothetical protein